MKSLTLILLAAVAVCQIAAQSIRDLDLATMESLGSDIYLQDMVAAEATDILLTQKLNLSEYPIRGWIVENIDDQAVVTFVADYDGDLRGVFEVRKKGKRKGKFSRLKSQELSEPQLAQFRARTLAMESIDQPCSERYNFVVLPDIDQDGFIVYALAATTDPTAVLVGGHYRMMISPDGQSLKQKDKLFRSCLVLSKSPPDMPRGAKLAALYLNHIVSDTPVEIHVYLSLLHKMAFYVMTREEVIWKVDKGRIEKIKAESDD